MSNEVSHVEFERYKELYKEYIQRTVELHNAQLTFMQGDGFHSAIAPAAPVREMRKLLALLRQQSIKVRQERYRNKQIIKKIKRGRKPYDKAAEWERKRWLIPPDKL